MGGAFLLQLACARRRLPSCPNDKLEQKLKTKQEELVKLNAEIRTLYSDVAQFRTTKACEDLKRAKGKRTSLTTAIARLREKARLDDEFIVEHHTEQPITDFDN